MLNIIAVDAYHFYNGFIMAMKCYINNNKDPPRPSPSNVPSSDESTIVSIE